MKISEISKQLTIANTDDEPVAKRIMLRKEEAQYLYKRGVKVYVERIYHEGKKLEFYFIFITLEELVNFFAKR